MASPLDPGLAARLRECGVDPDRLGDPAADWQSLHRRFGRRATLIDRYALEAAHREIPSHDLERALRDRLAVEVLQASYPGFAVVLQSDRGQRDPVEVVPYDPAWPRRFEEWRDRLAGALGRIARRIDHVGSTAVPGLVAKPVIDIQVSVPEIEEEAAFAPAIERAGIAFRSRDAVHRYFRPSGDRPRVVQVHVCTAGSAWERDHLLFRDFLRSRQDVAGAYGQLKGQLADRYRDDRIAYNEAKTNFILDAMEEAREWARKAGGAVASERAG